MSDILLLMLLPDQEKQAQLARLYNFSRSLHFLSPDVVFHEITSPHRVI